MCYEMRLGKGKGKVHPRTGLEVYLYSFFNLGTRWRRVVNTTPRLLYPLERPGTPCIGDWVGPRVDLKGCGKFRPPPETDPRTA
jgi:hypothetical protein